MKKKLISILSCVVALTAFALPPNTQVIGDTTYQPYRVIKTAPCKLYAIVGYNSGPQQFVMIFGTNNPSGAAPTNTQVGQFSFPVAATNYFYFDASYYGANLDSVSVANSTNPTNYVAGLTNCAFQAIISPNQ